MGWFRPRVKCLELIVVGLQSLEEWTESTSPHIRLTSFIIWLCRKSFDVRLRCVPAHLLGWIEDSLSESVGQRTRLLQKWGAFLGCPLNFESFKVVNRTASLIKHLPRVFYQIRVTFVVFKHLLLLSLVFDLAGLLGVRQKFRTLLFYGLRAKA